MTDSLSTPPADHGSDRYDYVEVTAPQGIRPLGEWWDSLIAQPCNDCLANVFATFVGPGEPGDEWLRSSWDIALAHDETCPFYASLDPGEQR